ncbi:MAG TPA: hypothetical protein VN617_05685 [Rhodoferax sp.]|jgi:hypothetical protein|nr:hypothetical protein [Rhodoferax sp.]
MNRLFTTVVFAGFCVVAAAQTANVSPDQAAVAERAAINAERSRSEAAYLAEKKVCYQKFAVNGCLRDAGERERKIRADLRRREITLDDAQRKRQAVEQSQRRKAGAAAEQQSGEQAAARRAQGTQNLQKQQERAADNESDRAKAAASARENAQEAQSRMQRHLDETASQARKAAAAPAERARYEEKLKAAAEKKAQLDKQLQKNTNPPAKPLPIPP